MASNLKTILAQVGTQLKTANGAGVYTYDLSGAGTVVRGAVLEPPGGSDTVAVGYYLSPFRTEPGERLGFYERTAMVSIHGWVQHDGTEGDAEDAAVDLCNDIMRSLEADRTLGSNVRDLKLDATAFSGTLYGWDGWGVVALDLTINWSQETGV